MHGETVKLIIVGRIYIRLKSIKYYTHSKAKSKFVNG